MKVNKYCQSCGMPMKKDPEKGGTNKDGSKNMDYCSYCFQNGAFTQAGFSLDEMKSFVKGKMIEMGFPRFLAGFFTNGIGKLKRWKK